MRFMERVGRTEVKQGEAAIFWLGQAGFLIKTAKGRQIAIDPYFSDCVQRLIPEKGLGFKRLMLPVCEAGEFDLDVLIISHEHNDHFDVDAVRDLVKGKTAVYTNCLVAEEMERMGSRLYYAGDTALTVDRLKVPVEMKPEVAILPINGAFGNLDGAEAAKYAGMLGCRVCIPCHFWTFPLHHGDPQQIIDCIGKEAPECELVLLCQGEAYRMGAFS